MDGWMVFPAKRDHKRATASMAMGSAAGQDRNLSQDIQCRASAAVSSVRITGPIRRVTCVFLVYTVLPLGRLDSGSGNGTIHTGRDQDGTKTTYSCPPSVPSGFWTSQRLGLTELSIEPG